MLPSCGQKLEVFVIGWLTTLACKLLCRCRTCTHINHGFPLRVRALSQMLSVFSCSVETGALSSHTTNAEMFLRTSLVVSQRFKSR